MRPLDEIPADAKSVLIRADYNIPISEGQVTDDSRIVESLPTINWLLAQSRRVVIVTHLGRPDGVVREELRVDPIAARLADLIGRPVALIREKPGKEAFRLTKSVPEGEVVLLENIRFYPEEEKNDPRFAKALALFGDVFVNEAFSVSHRAHASVVGVAEHLPAYAGFHLMKELKALETIRRATKRPFALILGGKKLKDKIPVIEHFIGIAEVFIFGGGVGNTFVRAQGWNLGRSLVDEAMVSYARTLMARIHDTGATVVLPVDFVYEDREGMIRSGKIEDFPTDGFVGDIGEETLAAAIRALERVQSVFWNGPLGIFEKEGFGEGCLALLKTLSDLRAYRVGGGGDTMAMVKHFGMEGAFDYLSSAGGAAMEFIGGKNLPGIVVLNGSR
ncbi:MAG: phosphoglycerate kinase [bacterium JZ-2024 1]